VIGRAANVWHEVEDARRLFSQSHTIVVVGRVGIDCPFPIHYWVSYHGNEFEGWCSQRALSLRLDENPQFWSSSQGRRIDASESKRGIRYLNTHNGGSSGLLGALVARQVVLGNKIILAGVPMTKEGGRFDQSGEWEEAEQHRAAWMRCLDQLLPYVRSMSGWTQSVFGTLTREWLDA
jgi:hypothetical protein